MKTTRKCLACKAQFVTDHRNGHRQGYCAEDACQRARRRQEQRLRRARAKSKQLLREALEDSSGLQTASQAGEAFFGSQSAVVIGLISREDLQKTIWRFWQRGQSILGSDGLATQKKRPNTK